MKRVTVASTLSTLAVLCILVIVATTKTCDGCFSLPGMMAKFFICGLIVFIGSIYYAVLYLKGEKYIYNIDALPLLKTDEAVEGLPFSGEGKVEQDYENLLYSPYANLRCVYYHSITEEGHWTGKRNEWVIIENLIGTNPFYISDKRGRLKVDLTNIDNDFSGFKIGKEFKNRAIPDPDLSEVDCDTILKNNQFQETKLFADVIPLDYKRRRSEFILSPETKVFVYGYVSKNSNGLFLREHPNHPLLISKKTKRMYVEEFYRGNNLVYFIHLLLSIGFTISVLSSNFFLKLNQPVMSMILFAGNFMLAGSIVLTVYNRIITLKQRAICALKSIDIELKRRAELIPVMTDLVKNYSGHEKDLNLTISQIRSHVVFEKVLSDRKKLDFAPLLAIAEEYPDLKASENYLKLMKILTDTEDRIAYSRAFYNRSVRKLNTLISQFPFLIIARLLKINSMDFISIQPG